MRACLIVIFLDVLKLTPLPTTRIGTDCWNCGCSNTNRVNDRRLLPLVDRTRRTNHGAANPPPLSHFGGRSYAVRPIGVCRPFSVTTKAAGETLCCFFLGDIFDVLFHWLSSVFNYIVGTVKRLQSG